MRASSIQGIAALAAGFCLALATTGFAAPAGQLITVDENGNMDINGVPGPQGVLGLEPISGQTTLMYVLPFPGLPGDVGMIEPATGAVEDLIRFSGNSTMFFFSYRSAAEVEPPDLADGAIPQLIIPAVMILEVGPEGNNGAFYSPNGGPGDNTTLPNYHFISDVPEPTTMLLMGIGGVFMATRRRRQASMA